MEDKERKRKRGLNFSPRETLHLFSIALKYKNILENKQTNAVANSDKMQAWNKITREYNATSSDLNPRSSDQLKRCYDNKKQSLRKKKANVRQEALRTGGGIPPPEVKWDDLDNLILAVMDPLTTDGHYSIFDSDDFSPDYAEKNTDIELVFENLTNNTHDDSDKESNQGSREFVVRSKSQYQFFLSDPLTNAENEGKLTPAMEPMRSLSNKEICDQVPSSSRVSYSVHQFPSCSGSGEQNYNFDTYEESNEISEIDQERQTAPWREEEKKNWKNYKTNDFKRPLNPALVRHNVGDNPSDENEKEGIEKSKKQSKVAITRSGTARDRQRLQVRGQTRRAPDRRRPTATIVKSMASSALAEKYELLADKKNIIADQTIKKLKREEMYADEEHQLRKKSLELEIEMRKKQLEKLSR